MQDDQKILDYIRDFNRYYTNVIGLLDQHFLDSSFSLTEGRVLYEIRFTEACTAKKIREKITIDEGYVSRIIDKFWKQGLIVKSRSPIDRRLHIIELTERGQREFLKINENSNRLISQMIAKLSPDERQHLVGMMERIRQLLSKDI